MKEHVTLTERDLGELPRWFPSLRFDDADQVRALLHMDTADFQAVPGSGKTTLLGAKLALIANKWQHTHRGICVLSHTNVAKNEIEGRLRSTPGGEALLAYPHFIGTIQTFVNRYLAIPWLRGKGIEVREVDDEIFLRRYLGRALSDYSIKPWVQQNQWDREASIRGVRYTGPDLEVATSHTTALPAKGKCIDRLKYLKDELAVAGIFRFDDMFAYAEQALRDAPGLAKSVAHRFPILFVDEMQDTHELQLGVLATIFERSSTVQRFGDVNQSVFRRGDNNHRDAFPRDGFFEVSKSLRFGPEIASAANKLKLTGGDMVGDGAASAAPPTLCLYSDQSITRVVGRFGEWAANLFSKEELSGSSVKAVCAVKRPGNAKQALGRNMLDYVPMFEVDNIRPSAARPSACELIRDACLELTHPDSFYRRLAAARSAILLLIRLTGHADFRDVSSWTGLSQRLRMSPQQVVALNRITLDIVQGVYPVASEAMWNTSLKNLLKGLAPIVPEGVDPPVCPELNYVREIAAHKRETTNRFHITANDREFDIALSSIAAVKGETHLATLVLESCNNRRFDLSELLPFLAGMQAIPKDPDAIRRAQLNNLFVAMTRAKRLVVLAVHVDRVDAKTQAALIASGWSIQDWTT